MEEGCQNQVTTEEVEVEGRKRESISRSTSLPSHEQRGREKASVAMVITPSRAMLHAVWFPPMTTVLLYLSF